MRKALKPLSINLKMNTQKLVKDTIRDYPLIGTKPGKLFAFLAGLYVAPGHFYSPIPSVKEVRKDEKKIFHKPKTFSAIDLNEAEQFRFFDLFKEFYKDLPFKHEKTDGLRYFFNNRAYEYSDAICLYSMIRTVRPKRIIEVGSGYSSCVMLDTNELFFDNSIKLTFIEPYPQLLESLIKEDDKPRIEIIANRLQDVPLERFSALEAGDILFIDSTHVSKTGSDVNYFLFEIFPVLADGVFVHIHDIHYPFEYPSEWIYEGRAWTEVYLLRAFLQYNSVFKIVFFNTYLEDLYPEKFEEAMPLCLQKLGGSIWLRKD